MDDKERLPYSEFPQDFKCPVCDKKFNYAMHLRNHAARKHQIWWEKKPGRSLKNSFAKKRGMKENSELQEITDLKPWHKVAIIQRFVFGHDNATVGKTVRKSPGTVGNIYNTIAGEKYIEELEKAMEDMPALLVMAFNSSLLGLAAQDAAALEMAKEVNDYEFIHKFVTDHYKITKVIDESKKSDSPQQNVIQIHLDGSSLDSPKVATSHKVIEAEVLDEDPDEVD